MCLQWWPFGWFFGGRGVLFLFSDSSDMGLCGVRVVTVLPAPLKTAISLEGFLKLKVKKRKIKKSHVVLLHHFTGAFYRFYSSASSNMRLSASKRSTPVIDTTIVGLPSELGKDSAARRMTFASHLPI